MKRSFWRHAGAVGAASAVLILALCFFSLRALGARETLALYDLEGERSALDGLRVGGRLYDAAHEIAFQIENGALTRKERCFSVSSQLSRGEQWPELTVCSAQAEIAPGARTKTEEHETSSTREDGSILEIKEKRTCADALAVRTTIFDQNGYMEFLTDLRLESDEMEFVFYEKEEWQTVPSGGSSGSGEAGDELSSQVRDSIQFYDVVLDGKTYVAVAAKDGWRGPCMLYTPESYGYDGAEDGNGRVRPLAELWRAEEGFTLLGLFCLNGDLLVAADKGGALTLSLYDAESGALLDTLVPEGVSGVVSAAGAERTRTGAEQSLVLFLEEEWQSRVASSGALIAAVSAKGNELALTHLVRQSFSAHCVPDTVLQAAVADGKLVWVAWMHDPKETYPDLGATCELRVYGGAQGGELLYRGVIATDAQEDKYAMLADRTGGTYYADSYYFMRTIDDITVEEAAR